MAAKNLSRKVSNQKSMGTIRNTSQYTRKNFTSGNIHNNFQKLHKNGKKQNRPDRHLG